MSSRWRKIETKTRCSPDEAKQCALIRGMLKLIYDNVTAMSPEMREYMIDKIAENLSSIIIYRDINDPK